MNTLKIVIWLEFNKSALGIEMELKTRNEGSLIYPKISNSVIAPQIVTI